MEVMLLIVIVLQFIYMFFKDIKVSDEREKMLLKIMSKDVNEYKVAVEDRIDESPEPKEPEIVPIENVSFEKIMKAK